MVFPRRLRARTGIESGLVQRPCLRGMLMHTKVFGKYNGPEDVMERTDGYTEINVIDNYAPSAKAVITVTDANGKPVKDALVEFKIYNYAEFNSVARKKTDADGKCSLSAGKGICWYGPARTASSATARSLSAKTERLRSLEQETGRCGDDRPRYHTTGGRLYPSGSYTGAKGGERQTLIGGRRYP